MGMETLSEAIARLERAGYRGSFVAQDAGVRCSVCDWWHDAAQLGIDDLVRFEGASDADDEALLLALTCDHCGAKGTYVTAYGPDMDPADAAVVERLEDHRRR